MLTNWQLVYRECWDLERSQREEDRTFAFCPCRGNWHLNLLLLLFHMLSDRGAVSPGLSTVVCFLTRGTKRRPDIQWASQRCSIWGSTGVGKTVFHHLQERLKFLLDTCPNLGMICKNIHYQVLYKSHSCQFFETNSIPRGLWCILVHKFLFIMFTLWNHSIM